MAVEKNSCQQNTELRKQHTEAQESPVNKPNVSNGRKEGFPIARQILNNNRGIVDEQCFRNDYGKVTADDNGIRNAWKEYDNCVLNKEFHWDRNSQPSSSSVGPPPLLESCKGKESLNRMKNDMQLVSLE